MASETLHSQTRLQPDAIVSGSWLCCCAANWLRASDYLQELQQSLQRADQLMYNSMLSACEAFGRWRSAVQCCSAFTRLSFRRDVFSFSSLLSSHTRRGHWQAAQSIFQATAKVNRFLHSGLLAAYENCGRWQDALDCLRHGSSPDLICYSAAISACEKACKWQEGSSAPKIHAGKASFL